MWKRYPSRNVRLAWLAEVTFKRAQTRTSTFKWSSIPFAVRKSAPAELGTRFSRLIFIRTAIDFNELVNRHTPTPLSATLTLVLFCSHLLQCPLLLCVCVCVLFHHFTVSHPIFPQFEPQMLMFKCETILIKSTEKNKDDKEWVVWKSLTISKTVRSLICTLWQAGIMKNPAADGETR